MKQFEIKARFQSTTQNPLRLSLCVDKVCFYDKHSQDHAVSYLFEYDENSINEHSFTIKVDGKRKLIDELEDTETCLTMIELAFDSRDVKPLIKGTYTHDQNGFGETTTEALEEFLGLDGVAEFKFFTPMSYWFSAQYPF